MVLNRKVVVNQVLFSMGSYCNTGPYFPDFTVFSLKEIINVVLILINLHKLLR